MGPMMNAIEEREVDPLKTIAFVAGANQEGNRIKIRGLNEKFWPSDCFYIGPNYFVSMHEYEPNEGTIEIEIHPPIIPSGLYRNVESSPKDGAEITRGYSGK
jgi:hypothetical protein